VTIGNNRLILPGSTFERSSASRACIQFRLPRMVLISPLCAMNRYGWASGQLGKVLVENLECTRAIALAVRGSVRSGKNAGSWSGVSMPLYVMVREDSDGRYAPMPRWLVSRSACLRMQNAARSSSSPVSGSPARSPVSRPAETKTWRMYGRASSAEEPRPSGRTGTSRQPRISPPSTSAYFSMILLARARARGSLGRNTRPVAYRPAGGSSKSSTPRYSSSGIWIMMPAPSPVLYSAPRAPRWSRRINADRPLATTSWERRPYRSATRATPQASFSCAGW
jgi:hypothetical protein